MFLRRENDNISTAQTEYAKYLSRLRPWRWWFTGTFASPAESSSATFEALPTSERTARSVQPEGAVKAFHEHLRHAQCLAAESRGEAHRKPVKGGGFKWVGRAARDWTKGIRPDYVLTLERNKHNTGVHIHALVSDHEFYPVTFDAMRSWWDKQGMGKVIEIRPGEVTEYEPTGEVLPVAERRARYMLKYSLKQHDSELAIAPWLGCSAEACKAGPTDERSEEGQRPSGAELLLALS